MDPIENSDAKNVSIGLDIGASSAKLIVLFPTNK